MNARPKRVPRGDRRQVAVEQARERELQRVLGAEDERGDADLEHRDRAQELERVEALLEPLRQRPAQHEQAEAEHADEQREREEVRPADDVLAPRRPLRADGLRGRRRRHADAEGVDARDDVAVARERVPADGVGALRQLRQRARSGRGRTPARAESDTSRPLAAKTWIAFGSAFTPWSKCSRTSAGGSRARCSNFGVDSSSVAWANAEAGAASAASATRRSARLIGAAARRAVTGGRRSARRRGRRTARPRSRGRSARSRCSTRPSAGRTTRPSASTVRPSSVQPRKWCRKAERWKSHGFCSCTSSATPPTVNASGTQRRHAGLVSFPLTSPISAAPASIITCAQEPWASMWIVELVKNTITGHIRTPMSRSVEARDRRATPGAATPPPRRRPPRASSRRARGTRPRTSSGRARQPAPSGLLSACSRSSSRPGATTSANSSPTPTTYSGGSTNSHQKPCPCGCSSVTRYGWSSAQPKPAAIVSGPSSPIVLTRHERRATRSGAWLATCDSIVPPTA